MEKGWGGSPQNADFFEVRPHAPLPPGLVSVPGTALPKVQPLPKARNPWPKIFGYGQALESRSFTRRVLRNTTAPIFKRFNRIVPACARACSVPAKPSARNRSSST